MRGQFNADEEAMRYWVGQTLFVVLAVVGAAVWLGGLPSSARASHYAGVHYSEQAMFDCIAFDYTADEYQDMQYPFGNQLAYYAHEHGEDAFSSTGFPPDAAQAAESSSFYSAFFFFTSPSQAKAALRANPKYWEYGLTRPISALHPRILGNMIILGFPKTLSPFDRRTFQRCLQHAAR